MGTHQGQQLLPGERVVTSNNFFTLTNYRIYRDTSISGQSRYVSITLDAVSSCGLVTSSQPAFIVLAVVAGLVGFVLKGDAQVGAFVGALVFVVMYLASRSAVVSICSTGGEKITAPAGPDQRASLMVLLNAIDQQKLAALGRIENVMRDADEPIPLTPPPPRMASAPPGTW